MLASEEQKFVNYFNLVASQVHSITLEKGFWDDGINRNNGEMIALCHSELSEALEALRNGNKPSRIIPCSQVEEELADLIIRVMDMSHARKWDVASAIVAKIKYNEMREYRHGKEF